MQEFMLYGPGGEDLEDRAFGVSMRKERAGMMVRCARAFLHSFFIHQEVENTPRSSQEVG